MKGLFVSIVGLGPALFGLLFLLRPADAADCAPSVAVEALSAGLSRLDIAARCMPGSKVHLHYDSIEIIRGLNETGHLSFILDCFLGEMTPLTISFQDGEEMRVEPHTLDLDRVTKVAVIWKGSVNLDLHAFEYAAGLADENHIWAGAPASRWEAEERKKRDNRGHGFLSFVSDGRTEGDQLEVYTFVHEPHQSGGAITLALDYESRARNSRDPDTCGTGLYADLEYKVIVWRPGGRVSRSRGVFSAAACDQPSDGLARYSAKALPQLLFVR